MQYIWRRTPRIMSVGPRAAAGKAVRDRRKARKYIMISVFGLRGTQVVAVSHGYDTCFSGKACDGLCRLLKSTGLG